MNCKQYVFALTSGQLEEASTIVRMDARVHRWMCPNCRAFTRNDAQITEALANYRAQGRILPSPDVDSSES